LLRRALAIEDKAPDSNNGNGDLVTTLRNLAQVLRQLRKYDEADQLEARAKALQPQL
jgi:tetratricopeptide (TPR) repeat protein